MNKLKNNTILEAIKAVENSSIMRAIKTVENSSLIAAMRSFENSSAASAIKAFENSSVMRAIKDVENSSLIATMRSFENSSVMSTIRALQNSSQFASFNELAERCSSQNFGPLTLSEAYQFITESYFHTSGSSEIDRLENLACSVEHCVQKAPEGALSKEFYFSLVLSLFLFWLSHISSKQSEERMLLRIERFETTISQLLGERKIDENIEIFYVVDRAVKLRVRPDTNSEEIKILYPNTKVKLIMRKSKWIRIEYFDYIENTYVSGWAFKKYFTISNSKKKNQ